MGFLVILLMAMFLMIAYRATMNAFLTVKTFSLPIDSYEDILDTDMNVIVWKGTIWEDMFALSPKGSPFQTIHQTKVQSQLGLKELGGIDKALEIVQKGHALYSGSLVPLLNTPFYPCAVQDIPALRLTMPGNIFC